MASINELIQKDNNLKSAVENVVKSHTLKLKSNETKAKGQSVILPLMKKEKIKSEKVYGLNFSYIAGGKQSTFNKEKAKKLLLEQGFDPEIIELIWMESTKEGDKAEALRIS